MNFYAGHPRKTGHTSCQPSPRARVEIFVFKWNIFKLRAFDGPVIVALKLDTAAAAPCETSGRATPK